MCEAVVLTVVVVAVTVVVWGVASKTAAWGTLRVWGGRAQRCVAGMAGVCGAGVVVAASSVRWSLPSVWFMLTSGPPSLSFDGTRMHVRKVPAATGRRLSKVVVDVTSPTGTTDTRNGDDGTAGGGGKGA